MGRPIRLGLLPHRVSIERKTRATDGQGGQTESYAVLSTQVPVRIRPATASERQTAQREETLATHVVYTLPDLDVRRSDRLVSGLLRYEVVSVEDPSEADHHRHVTARRFEVGV
jgi:SPP1 family predicted phage head-tail adaptor